MAAIQSWCVCVLGLLRAVAHRAVQLKSSGPFMRVASAASARLRGPARTHGHGHAGPTARAGSPLSHVCCSEAPCRSCRRSSRAAPARAPRGAAPPPGGESTSNTNITRLLFLKLFFHAFFCGGRLSPVNNLMCTTHTGQKPSTVDAGGALSWRVRALRPCARCPATGRACTQTPHGDDPAFWRFHRPSGAQLARIRELNRTLDSVASCALLLRADVEHCARSGRKG